MSEIIGTVDADRNSVHVDRVPFRNTRTGHVSLPLRLDGTDHSPVDPRWLWESMTHVADSCLTMGSPLRLVLTLGTSARMNPMLPMPQPPGMASVCCDKNCDKWGSLKSIFITVGVCKSLRTWRNWQTH